MSELNKVNGPDNLDMDAAEAKRQNKSYGHYMEARQRRAVVVVQCDGVERQRAGDKARERSFMSWERLRAGDTIKCHNYEEQHKVLEDLKKKGIKSDYLYEKDGKAGMWILIK